MLISRLLSQRGDWMELPWQVGGIRVSMHGYTLAGLLLADPKYRPDSFE
jgi:hypothetical protein